MLFADDQVQVVSVSDEYGAIELAAHLHRLSRSRITAVAIAPRNMAEPPIDLSALARDFDIDIAVVAPVETKGIFNSKIPKQLHVDRGYVRFFMPSEDDLENLDSKDCPYTYYDYNDPDTYKDRVWDMARSCASFLVQPNNPNHSSKNLTPPASTPRLTSSEVNFILTEADLDGVCRLIRDAARNLAVVIVTKASGAKGPYVDTVELAHKLNGLAYIVEAPVASLMWFFTENFPGCAVFGGASRVFPPRSTGNYELSSDRYLYFAYSYQEGLSAAERIVADVNGFAAFANTADAGVEAVDFLECEAEVAAVYSTANCAACYYESRSICFAFVSEALRPFAADSPWVVDLPADRVFAKGMHVVGRLDPRNKTLVDFGAALIVSPGKALSSYKGGQTVLARVESVSEDGCSLALFPGFVVWVPIEDVVTNILVRPSDVFSEGQILTVYLAECGEDPAEWLLSINEAGESPTASAPSLLLGGPPWLCEEDLAPLKQVSEDQQISSFSYREDDADDLMTDDAGPNARRVIRGISCELRRQQSECESAKRRIIDVKRELENSKRKLLSAQRKYVGEHEKRYRLPTIESLTSQETHALESRRFDYLILETWLITTPCAERLKNQLPKVWFYGDHLFETLANMDVVLDKVLRCMVDVLKGLDSKRNTHLLRSGEGAEDAPRHGSCGEPVFRCYVEVGRPQAARLHFMRSAERHITFLSVRRHDDYRT